MIPCSYWASACVAVLPSYTTFMISVRQVKVLPPASFRFHLTMDTLALGYSLPATGRLRDFHPLEHAPAGRTTKKVRQHTTLTYLFIFPQLYYFHRLASNANIYMFCDFSRIAPAKMLVEGSPPPKPPRSSPFGDGCASCGR